MVFSFHVARKLKKRNTTTQEETREESTEQKNLVHDKNCISDASVPTEKVGVFFA